MGRKHREKRKKLKEAIRRNIPKGWFENELGQLQKRVSKAEARKALMRYWATLKLAQEEIIDLVNQKAREEIQALEDERFLKELDRAAFE